MWETFAQKTPSSTFQQKKEENVEEKERGMGGKCFKGSVFISFEIINLKKKV